MIDNAQVREKLSIIKKTVLARPARFKFSSYLEYICGTKIDNFSSKEIEKAAAKFIPILEEIVERGNLAQELKNPKPLPQHFQLNTGAAILGFCYITDDFIEDLRKLPNEVYWAIWFCIELLEYSATNNIDSIDSLTTISESDQKLFHVPTGHAVSYLTTPAITHQGLRTHILELMDVKEELIQDEQ